MHERFHWPTDKVLLLEMGVVATPGPTKDNPITDAVNRSAADAQEPAAGRRAAVRRKPRPVIGAVGAPPAAARVGQLAAAVVPGTVLENDGEPGMTNADWLKAFVIRHSSFVILSAPIRLAVISLDSVLCYRPMSSATPNPRRVVITGLGLISPLGSTPARLWPRWLAGKSGVAATTLLPADRQPLKFAGRGPAVHRRNRRFRPARKGDEEGHQEGPQGDVPRDADGRRRRPIGHRPTPGSPRSRSTPNAPASCWAATTCSPCPKTIGAGMREVRRRGRIRFRPLGQRGPRPDDARCGCSSTCPTCRPATSRSTTTSAARTIRSRCARRPSNLAIGEAFRTIQRGHANA